MKKFKKLIILSDGCCYPTYEILTSLKTSKLINFQKIDYKNSIVFNKNSMKTVSSQYSKKYIKKFYN